MNVPITALILTHDEAANLQRSLPTLAGCVSRIVVVDSGSADATVAVARSHGAEVLAHPFESHTAQWRWALDQVDAEWILGLDADQRLTPELQQSLRRLQPDGMDGFYLNRRQIFRGRWIRHGGYYPKYLLKLFRKSAVSFDPTDLMDHHFRVTGRTARLAGDLIEDNVKEYDIGFWLRKHVQYGERLAAEELLRRAQHDDAIAPDLYGSPDQRTAWIKRRWYTLPRYWRSVGYFLYRYFIRLGFLDGREGFIFHALQAFWLRLIADIYLEDLERKHGGNEHA